MTNKILIGALAIFAILGLSFAWGGFFMHNPDVSEEVTDEMKQAFEEKDFEAMKALREQYGPPINETLREEVDSLRGQIHDAMESGDYETAEDLRGQLHELMPGKGPGPMGFRGPGPMGFNCTCAEFSH